MTSSPTSSENIGFVQLYRPGRVTVVLAIAVIISIIPSLVFQGILFLSLIGIFVLFPFVLLIFESISRKRLLPRGKQSTELALQLKQLNVRWILRNSGGGVRGWNRIERGLPRTIVDSSLKEQLRKVTIPDGLIEPEKIHTSKPGSLLGCIVGVAFSAFIIWAIVVATLIVTIIGSMIKWLIIAFFLLNIIQLILGLPVVHRSRKLPKFLRAVGRRRLLSRPIVVGPGWVKFSNTVWRADRDMFFIRRTGFRLASSELDCMFVGPNARQRMTFSGVGDEDFQLLFGAWNVEDVRVEFIDSELS